MLRPALIVLSSAALTSCTTVADLKKDEPFIQVTTPRSVQDFASCLSEQWESRSGTTSTAPRPNGMSLTLSYKVYSQSLPAVAVNVDDQGTTRLVTVYARKGDGGDKLRREIQACL